MKVLVVDDEPLARERLLRLLQRLRPQAEGLEAEDGVQALAQIERHSPDLLLLDIRMPGMDGLEVAAELSERENPPAIIFCTAYDDHALQALQHQVVAYLLKPVREEELERALQNAGRVNRVQMAQISKADAGEGRTYITSQSHRGLESIPVAEVRCFMAEDKYVTAYGPDGMLVIPESLKELEDEFAAHFVRAHRNALVALAHIDTLSRVSGGGWELALEGIELRPQVSRRHLKDVKARLLAR